MLNHYQIAAEIMFEFRGPYPDWLDWHRDVMSDEAFSWWGNIYVFGDIEESG